MCYHPPVSSLKKVYYYIIHVYLQALRVALVQQQFKHCIDYPDTLLTLDTLTKIQSGDTLYYMCKHEVANDYASMCSIYSTRNDNTSIQFIILSVLLECVFS